MKSRQSKCFQNSDFYAQGISFQIEGQNWLPTWPGVILSAITLVFMVGYTVVQFSILVNRNDSKYQSYEELNRLDIDKAVMGDDVGVEVAYLISTYATEYQDMLPEIFESAGF